MTLLKSCLMLVIITSVINAGEIFGTVFGPNGKTLPNLKMVLKSDGAIKDSTFSDEDGEYSLFKSNTGTCIIEISYEKKELQLEANSYNDAVRYNLNIVKDSDSNYSINRR